MITNPTIAAVRKSVIISGRPAFSRRGYAVACIEHNKLIHVETFYGDDGRVLLGRARRYQRQFQAGQSLGLGNPVHRMPNLSTSFNTAVNRAAIKKAMES